MGQKVRPIGLRLGINRTWDSRWYANKNYGRQLIEDLQVREYLHKKLGQAGISHIVIERPAKKVRITIHTARPGVVIGKKGSELERLRGDLMKQLNNNDVSLNIVEVRKPEVNAQIVSDSIARQIEQRISYRRAMKRAVQSALRLGGKGIRINCSGRLAGAEIARMEWYREGRVPLHTLRADVDFGLSTASTTYGIIGIKVWIYRGDIMENDPTAHERRQNEI